MPSGYSISLIQLLEPVPPIHGRKPENDKVYFGRESSSLPIPNTLDRRHSPSRNDGVSLYHGFFFRFLPVSILWHPLWSSLLPLSHSVWLRTIVLLLNVSLNRLPLKTLKVHIVGYLRENRNWRHWTKDGEVWLSLDWLCDSCKKMTIIDLEIIVYIVKLTSVLVYMSQVCKR